MTTTTTEARPVTELLAEARAERDAAIAAAEDADTSGWDKSIIATALSWHIDSGRPFSANTLRELLPDVRTALIGSAFLHAAQAGRIRRVGLEASTKRNTHGKSITVWIGAPR